MAWKLIVPVGSNLLSRVLSVGSIWRVEVFPVKYTLAFLGAGFGLVVLVIMLGGWATLLLWPALCFFLLSIAYARNDASWFGKRIDGRLIARRAALFAPYLVLTWVCWAIYVRLSRERWSDEVAPLLWVGRRPSPRHLPHDALVVDMTAEFPSHSAIIRAGRLTCVPTLDARSPGPRVLRQIGDKLAAETRPIYIHCAQGHGRSATLAAVVMVIRGDAETVSDAMTKMVLRRPLVHLHSVQRRDAEAALCVV